MLALSVMLADITSFYETSFIPCRDGIPTSSGRQALNNSKNNFERGAIDVFHLTLPNLGTVQRLLIGHDSYGAGSAWHLAEVRVLCVQTGQEVCFAYGDWLSKTDAPYQTQVELVPLAAGSHAGPGLCRYGITVYTSDIRGAGENCRRASPTSVALQGGSFGY